MRRITALMALVLAICLAGCGSPDPSAPASSAGSSETAVTTSADQTNAAPDVTGSYVMNVDDPQGEDPVIAYRLEMLDEDGSDSHA
ncbi:hypothetical protein SAMN02910456_01428 [Ruminococcaceae bacterium YRB3002]|nr:hypothetical protein SAMN02910456_01428 [Ruminococcaceae bacterium YRB3002]